MRNDKIIIATHIKEHMINNQLVLENIEFDLKEGDYMGIIGPNGAGKSTLIRILAGIEKPTNGQIEYFFEHPNNIGYVPQKAGEKDFPANVEEVIRSGLMPRNRFNLEIGKYPQVIDEYARVVRDLDLEHLLGRMFSDLSGGERQRVMIARALVSRPKVLILDEPTTGIDLKTEINFYDFLEGLNSKYKMTIILVSHDIEAIARQVKTVLCLNRKLVCVGPSKEFINAENISKLYGEHVKYVVHKH